MIRETDFRRADLNLLVLFRVLMTERHVGRAAARLGLTQSAASQALRRLRSMFDDALFVRHPRGVEPTPRAMELAPAVGEILERTYAILPAANRFDPEAARTFTIAVVDYSMPMVVVPLVSRLSMLAPQVDLRIVSIDRGNVVDAFDRQLIDVALLWRPEFPDRFVRTPVLQDRMIVIARKGHPALRKKPLTIEQFAALPQLVVSASAANATNFVDDLLAARGLRRRIALSVPSYLAAPDIVARSDLIALYAERLARRLGRSAGLAIHEAPLELPAFVVEMVINRQRLSDPALTWLREQIEATCSGMDN